MSKKYVPIGVSQRKDGLWRAYISRFGKKEYIGIFYDKEDAENVYNIAKQENKILKQEIIDNK